MKRSLIALLSATLLASVALTSVAAAQESPAPAKPAPDGPKPAEKNGKDTAGKDAGGKKSVTAETAAGPLDFSMKDIDGNDVELSKYRGKVVVIVNVASKCGLTPQYAQLQKLHEEYAERGLAILAFPANNFMGQEPGSNSDIKEFCKTKYKVGFDLFSKISVKGDDSAELYKYLTDKQKNEKLRGEIDWNFAKFVVDRNGEVIHRFKPSVKPDSPDFRRAVETALDAKPGSKGG